jgi:hypothetical protein
MQRRKNTPIENDIESVALGTLLTGMRKLYWETEQYMRSRIEEVEHRYRQLVGTARVVARHEVDDDEAPRVRDFVKKKLGRPRKLPARYAPTGRSGWPDDPEERSREMKRRQKVAALNRQARESGQPVVRLQRKNKPSHPRDADHPDHEKWLAASRRGHRKAWDALSSKERKARLAAMVAGRKTKVNGSLEATA